MEYQAFEKYGSMKPISESRLEEILSWYDSLGDTLEEQYEYKTLFEGPAQFAIINPAEGLYPEDYLANLLTIEEGESVEAFASCGRLTDDNGLILKGYDSEGEIHLFEVSGEPFEMVSRSEAEHEEHTWSQATYDITLKKHGVDLNECYVMWAM